MDLSVTAKITRRGVAEGDAMTEWKVAADASRGSRFWHLGCFGASLGIMLPPTAGSVGATQYCSVRFSATSQRPPWVKCAWVREHRPSHASSEVFDRRNCQLSRCVS